MFVNISNIDIFRRILLSTIGTVLYFDVDHKSLHYDLGLGILPISVPLTYTSLQKKTFLSDDLEIA